MANWYPSSRLLSLPRRLDWGYTRYKTDSIHLYLADSNGNWKGKGIGELRQFTQTNSFKAVSEKRDTIIGFKIFHLMQDNPLPKIYDIGLRIHGH